MTAPRLSLSELERDILKEIPVMDPHLPMQWRLLRLVAAVRAAKDMLDFWKDSDHVPVSAIEMRDLGKALEDFAE